MKIDAGQSARMEGAIEAETDRQRYRRQGVYAGEGGGSQGRAGQLLCHIMCHQYQPHMEEELDDEEEEDVEGI